MEDRLDGIVDRSDRDVVVVRTTETVGQVAGVVVELVVAVVVAARSTHATPPG